MATCSFLGHAELYDVDIEGRLQAAVDRIVAENETVEFLLYDHGEFYDQCLLASMRARSRNPQKVTITLVSDRKYIEYATRYRKDVPLHMVDKIVIPSIAPSKSQSPTIPLNRLMRWTIQNSTHLVCYVYRGLHERVNYLLDFATSQSLEIFPVTSEDTEQAIIALSVKLPEQERFVLERINEGQVYSKIAANLNVSTSRIGQILHHGGRTIRKNLKHRYYKRLPPLGERQMRSCSIFSMGNVTGEALSIYESFICSLVVRYNVGNFYIEYVHSNSNILNIVKKAVQYRPHHTTVVTDSEEYLEPIEKPEDIISAFCPPYDTLECIAQLDYLGITKVPELFSILIDRADFCICDLSVSHYSDAIKDYVSQRGETVLLDMGKANARIDFS